MAKEIVIWCDPCIGEDIRTPSREYRLSVGGTIKTVDLCDAHADQFVKPLEALIDEFGAPVDAAPPKAARSATSKRVAANNNREKGGPNPEVTLLNFTQTGTRKGRKPESGERPTECLWCPLSYAADGSGFVKHLHVAHGLPRSIKDVFDGACPICGKEDITILSSHVKKSHEDLGFDSITQAYAWARDNGDPHGAYAAVLAKAPVLG